MILSNDAYVMMQDIGTPNKSTHTNSSGAAGSRSNWLNELSRKTEDNLREDNALPYYSANSTHATSNSRNTVSSKGLVSHLEVYLKNIVFSR